MESEKTEPTETTEPTGPIPFVLPIVPEEVVPAPPITIQELMESRGAVLAQEALDKTSLSDLLSESSETLRIPLFQWAAAGFPDGYIIKSFTLKIPSICSDGVSRTASEYFIYCLGIDMVTLLEKLKSLTQGINFSYSFLANTLRIHVTRS